MLRSIFFYANLFINGYVIHVLTVPEGVFTKAARHMRMGYNMVQKTNWVQHLVLVHGMLMISYIVVIAQI